MGESYAMNGGDGAYSYTKNSKYQKQASDSAKDMIQEQIIEKLDTKILLSTSNTLSIADLGCSVGPNTFIAMQNAIEAVETKCSSQLLDSKNVEFQVFFNDHTANDFNTLFANLPLDRKYHAAGVPGSFYGRLFPRDSIGLAHSSYALQWLSKVPEGVSDSKSRAWNQGRVHYVGASIDVVNAYSDQFEKDLGVFMSARAEEIVRGGLMFLIIPGVPEGLSHSQLTVNAFFKFFGSSLLDLANEGVVDKSEIDAFNLPLYFPSLEELRKGIAKNGCFSIERMESQNPSLQIDISKDVHIMIRSARAVVEGTFTKHFGTSVVEKMFAKTEEKTEEISQFLEAGYPLSPQIFIVLKRK